MANLNKNPQHRANLGYSGFAMDKLHKFSSTVGELRPVYYDILNPGDKVSLSSIIKTRTMPIEAAAMCSLTEHIDWFFVPMTRLYKLFPEFYYGVNDNSTSFVNPNNLQVTYPHFKFSDLIDLVDDSASSAQSDKYFGVLGAYLRLFEDLGIPTKQVIQFFVDGTTSLDDVNYINLFAQAYQCIYMDKFRLSDWESPDADSYNLDKYYNSGLMNYTDVIKLFTLRYAPWKKDFFTDIQPTPLFGNGNESSLNNVNYGAVNQWLSSQSSMNVIDPSETVANNGNQSAVSIGQVATQAVQSINTANIRTIFAVEKLLEITRRAGKHYDKQTLAHFGVDVPMGLDGECVYIGGSSSKINIGDVIATSEDGLGKVGGKGYGYGQSGVDKFEAKCHGILMAIYHCVPDVDYQLQGMDRMNTYLNRVDFFQPEFDDLGMQPLFSYQKQLAGNPAINATIEGWQYRYKEIKQKFNTVIGALAGSLNYWTPSIVPYEHGNNSVASFLVSPHYLDDIMVTPYHPIVNTNEKDADAFYNKVFNTDPLIHELYLDVKKASKMSTYGLPNL